MTDFLNLLVFLAGLGLAVLVIASFWIPKILGWKEKLAGLSPLMRELFWTYAAYILMSHLFFAIVALGFRDWLISGQRSAAALSGYICLWWSARVYLQFFGFDLAEIEDTFWNRLAKHLLTLLFVYLAVVFGLLVWWNLGGAP